MKPLLFSLLAAAMFIASCQNADKQAPQIAGDFCNCFSKLEKSMSADSKNMIITASNSAAPEKSLEQGILALDEENQIRVSQEMIALNDLANENSELGICMKKVEKKYENSLTRDKKKFMEKVVAEMEAKGTCSLTAAFMRIGLKTGNFDK